MAAGAGWAQARGGLGRPDDLSSDPPAPRGDAAWGSRRHGLVRPMLSVIYDGRGAGRASDGPRSTGEEVPALDIPWPSPTTIPRQRLWGKHKAESWRRADTVAAPQPYIHAGARASAGVGETRESGLEMARLSRGRRSRRSLALSQAGLCCRRRGMCYARLMLCRPVGRWPRPHDACTARPPMATSR